jgi:Sec-independent protein translocase protein TatA
MEQRAFVKMIHAFQRRMNIASVLQKSIAALCIGAAAGILFQAAALVVPFYYASLYSGLALALSLLTALVLAYVKRISPEQAALAMDSFGFDERIITAYECLGQESVLVRLQREDAMNQLAEHQDRIRLALLPSWKKPVLLLGFLAVMSGLALLPSAVKERARELHEVRKEAREQMKELDELASSIDKLAQEEISQEQKNTLQEMLGSLEASRTEFEQADSAKLLSAATNKLEYKYAMMGSELEEFAKRLRDGVAASPMTAESMQVLAERMQELGGMQLAKGTGAQTGSNQQGQSGSQNGQGSSGSQAGQNGNGSQNGQNGSGSQTTQSGNQMSDHSKGSGRGVGSDSTPHDYVSVPNDITDSGNLTGNAANHEASEYFRAQNGLGWEGEHTTYESVLGSYEQKAYEGIDAGQYPSNMEEVIKEYFSSFNQ